MRRSRAVVLLWKNLRLRHDLWHQRPLQSVLRGERPALLLKQHLQELQPRLQGGLLLNLWRARPDLLRREPVRLGSKMFLGRGLQSMRRRRARVLRRRQLFRRRLVPERAVRHSHLSMRTVRRLLHFVAAVLRGHFLLHDIRRRQAVLPFPKR